MKMTSVIEEGPRGIRSTVGGWARLSVDLWTHGLMMPWPFEGWYFGWCTLVRRASFEYCILAPARRHGPSGHLCGWYYRNGSGVGQVFGVCYIFVGTYCLLSQHAVLTPRTCNYRITLTVCLMTGALQNGCCPVLSHSAPQTLQPVARLRSQSLIGAHDGLPDMNAAGIRQWHAWCPCKSGQQSPPHYAIPCDRHRLLNSFCLRPASFLPWLIMPFMIHPACLTTTPFRLTQSNPFHPHMLIHEY